MAIGYVNLVGSREAPDKTIENLLKTNWTESNTRNIKPEFQSDSGEPDVIAGDDFTAVNLVYVKWFSTIRMKDSNEINGDTIHHWMHRLVVGVIGENITQALLFCDEVNRIIWQFAPGNATRLDKSDGSDSEADHFEQTEIDFERIAPNSDIDNKPNFEGFLEIHFRRAKT